MPGVAAEDVREQVQQTYESAKFHTHKQIEAFQAFQRL